MECVSCHPIHSHYCVIPLHNLASRFMHTITGVDHKSSFPLLVYRICEALMWCIKPERFYVVLHKNSETQTSKDMKDRFRPRPRVEGHPVDQTVSTFEESIQFLASLSIMKERRNLFVWDGDFTSDKKMMRTLMLLRHLNDSQQFVYHSDLDEFPDRQRLSYALTELRSGSCDVIIGYWRDRISLSGYPTEVTLQQSLEGQFPISCRFSSKFMPRRTTQKMLVYRANTRATSGQHSLWCDVPIHLSGRSSTEGYLYDETNATNHRTDTLGTKHFVRGRVHGRQGEGGQGNGGQGRGSKGGTGGARDASDDLWKRTRACVRHVAIRADKSTPARMILDLLPVMPHKPRQCKTKVPIDHYKFVSGVEMYLFKRAVSYKQKGLGWWRQSYNILDHMRQHQGRVCTSCPDMNCTRLDVI